VRKRKTGEPDASFSDLPIAGFGIANQNQVADVQRYADAAVVSSALVAEIERLAGQPEPIWVRVCPELTSGPGTSANVDQRTPARVVARGAAGITDPGEMLGVLDEITAAGYPCAVSI
jgi:hypothetical protein